jgi:hypothetical protein
VPPLAEAEVKFVEELFAKTPTHVAAFEGWPGQSSVWRDISGLDPKGVGDWFSFLGIQRKMAE